MRWIAVSLGAIPAAGVLAWALVTTGSWPLDDRKQPASAVYALNGALGRWLVDHGEPIQAGADRREAGGAARAGGPAPDPASGGLTAAELAAAQQALRTDPRFRDRFPFRKDLTAAASSGRG
ncbi:MAG TPA: hypothetical protein VFI16_05925 [Anaeromyxobacteraceae bacterium]|nr:hypothetical protein [Anaeromyxobacteraceae bacterium]